MADSKVINLAETTTPSGDDLLYLVEDALTLPQDRRITVQNLLNKNFALSFDGGPMTADFGKFWPDPAISLGNFFWEAWVKPQGNFTGYVISDGYGGAHALLFGLSGGPSGYIITGNVYDGVGNTTFSGDEGPIENEWCHIAVGWDGATIVTYYNGVPVGKVAFAGPRKTQGVNGNLYIGGSDHSNFKGLISQVRGFDTTNPRNYAPANKSPLGAFLAQTVLTPIYRTPGSVDNTATFLAHFFRPNPIQRDLMSTTRAGLLRGLQGQFSAFGSAGGGQGYPTPQYVLDPTAPTYNTQVPPTRPTRAIAPATVPAGALIFDSFGRQDRTVAFDDFDATLLTLLGSTEGGSLGPKVWSDSGFGIIHGKAFSSYNQRLSTTVDAGTPNVDVRVDRAPGTWGSGISTGAVFRYQDASNYFAAFTQGTAANNQTLGVLKRIGGTITSFTVTPNAMPTTWTTLRVVSKADGTIQVYADATLVWSTNAPELTAATRVGLHTVDFGFDLQNRFKNFTVFAAS